MNAPTMRNWMRIAEDAQLSRVIAAAIRAKSQLSDKALTAIEEWQAANWNIGKLERSYAGTGDPEIRQSVDAAFAPVREILHAQYGNSIPLYRGQGRYEDHNMDKNRVLFSWTSSEKVAQSFSIGQNIKVLTDAEIAKAVADYERAGFAKVGKWKFLRSREYPGYFDIYRRNEYQTDGDDLEEFLRNEQRTAILHNEERFGKSSIVGYRVPIDAIVWITNDLNCKEFICRWNPLED